MISRILRIQFLALAALMLSGAAPAQDASDFANKTYTIEDENGAALGQMKTGPELFGYISWNIVGTAIGGRATEIMSGSGIYYLEHDNGHWSYIKWNGTRFEKIAGSHPSQRSLVPVP